MRVTIVDRNNFHTFQPLLYQVATSGLASSDVAYPVRGIVGRHANQTFLQATVIGADQAASLGDQIIGKPGSLLAAEQQLGRLSGQTVVFHSALTVINGLNYCNSVDIQTTCIFRTLTANAIRRYVAIDRPSDTAGSAKAECLGISLMESMDSSDPTAIIGLPLIALTRMLCEVGLDPLEHAKV